MKTLLVSSTSDAVGVSTHILNLAILLEQEDMLETIVCPTKGWLTDQLSLNNIPYEILRISYKPQSFIISSIRLFNFINKRKNIQTVHIHGRLPLFLSLLSNLLLHRKIWVSTIHQFSNVSNPGLMKWKYHLETFMLRKLNGICCVSNSLREEIICRLGEEYRHEVCVIPNWIEPIHSKVDAESELTLKYDANRICAVGRLSYEKGFDILIKAIDYLKLNGFYLKCDIWGEGPENKELVRLIKEKELSNQVFLMGVSIDIRSELPLYNAIVIPSRSESFGLVALEAFDARIPVVSSEIPGLNEIVINEYSGLTFKPGDEIALAACIKRVVTNEETGKELQINGLEVLKRFTPNIELIQKYNMFYTGNVL